MILRCQYYKDLALYEFTFQATSNVNVVIRFFPMRRAEPKSRSKYLYLNGKAECHEKGEECPVETRAPKTHLKASPIPPFRPSSSLAPSLAY